MIYMPPTYFGFRPTGSGGAASDLVSACIARLRASAPVVLAFGDVPTAARGNKFQGDKFVGQPDPPYLLFGEPQETKTYYSGGGWLARGDLAVTVWAASKLSARDLADLVASTLNDAPLTYSGATLLWLRARTSMFSPTGDVGVGVPTLYQRAVTFDYLANGSIT